MECCLTKIPSNAKETPTAKTNNLVFLLELSDVGLRKVQKDGNCLTV